MSATGQSVAPCWNCGQVVQAAATTCLWCGVAVRPSVTPLVVAPGGPAPAPAATSAHLPQQHVAQEQAPPQHVAPAADNRPYSVPQRPAPRPAVALGSAFAGTSTGVGAQLGAFSIDIATVVAIAVGVQLGFGSALITALAVVEALVFLWVLEARTGLTVGHLLLRIRSSRTSAPFSPGAGRAFARQAVLGAGLVVGVVGAWIVAASGAWDSSGLRRSIAARVAGTLAVTPPQATRPTPAPGRPAPRTSPLVSSKAAKIAAPRVVSTSTLGSSSIEDSHSASATGPTDLPSGSTPPVMVTSLDPAAPAPIESPEPANSALPAIAPVPGMAPPHPAGPSASMAAEAGIAPSGTSAEPASATPAPPTPAPAQGGALLLVFDTGQRVTLALGTAINLGRKPPATEPTDQLVAVHDPEGTVSKLHARLEHSRGQTWVTDQGSTNGTDLLDDDGATRLEPGVRTLVEDGTRTRLGNRSFTVSVLLDPTPQPEIPT